MSYREIGGSTGERTGNSAGCKVYAGNQYVIIMEIQPSCDFSKAEHPGAHYKVCVIEELVAKIKSSRLWH